jgi:serine phosphatase RsbU (regulator of sigma subunit)/anti-sigma regulatory factor (Ser/Thr protein kinase)
MGSRVLGVSANELLGKRLQDILPTETGEAVTADMRRAVDTGRARVIRVCRKPPHEDRTHEWFIYNTPIKDGRGHIRGLYCLGIDNTGEYEARRRLALVSEASGLIGSKLDTEQTALELAQVFVPDVTDFVTVDLLESLFEGREPKPGAADGSAEMRRMAALSVMPGCPETVLQPGETDTYAEYSPVAQTLASGESRIVGLQSDEAYAQHWAGGVGDRSRIAKAFGFHSSILVPIQARGTTLGVVTLHRHKTREDFTLDDLQLAEEVTTRAGVCVDNALRFTRQQSTALTLQHNLLPQDFPRQAAVEVIGRYLPSDVQAGVGGDWFDVIPLSGERVALAVGDVVGHGIHASAAMGRLRTAMRTLADLELEPDELLTRLDDVIAGPLAPGGEESDRDIGATCLYAVYDPVSRKGTVASAGHLPPALVRPDGETEFLDVPPGPPLGLGGLPFETREIELPAGSLLALYTDGLVESRSRDIDQGFDALRRCLAEPEESLEATSQHLLRELLPSTPTDDAALLLARTQVLEPDKVATWEFPSTPEAVAQARDAASEQLARWGLEETAFATEIIVSELVTNVVKHATGPIRLRLICEGSLICEVGDDCSAYPRLRRAHASDEGGRGLLLVAQLSRRWGTRPSDGGKIIWADQPIGAG